ncbi:MAG: 2-hydroxyacid dehydrogenase, partial [Pseudomonadota bacterium]
MRIAVFSAKSYDEAFLSEHAGTHELDFHEAHLEARTVALAAGSEAVCIFVNDVADRAALEALKDVGVRLILLRCAGFNNVDVLSAAELGLAVGRVPAYSPHAVAEHTIGLMLSLNRQIHRAYNRVRESNFALDGLLGFDMVGKTVGVVGTGEIGAVVCRILAGFGCRILANDPVISTEVEALGGRYVSLEALFAEADIATLHCPLGPATVHLVNAELLSRAKPSLMLINTSRGGLVDTKAVIAALKRLEMGSFGIDVYEEESELFFENLSSKVLEDDVFARLLTFPNVLITGHQGFFTHEAMTAIAQTTRQNADAFAVHG